MEWLRAEALRQTKLAFDDLVKQFNAAQNTPCVEEALETKHWSHAAFYPPVILFDDVVQVGTISNLDGIVPTVIELVIHAHAPQSGMGGLEAIQGNYSRLAVALESFTEEGLGGGDVTRSTEVGFDGFALFINSAVEVHPLTAYLEVGLVYAPGIADRPLVGLPTFVELWDVADDPAQDCARGDADAKFPGQLGQVPVTKLKAQVPPHTGNDNIVSKPAAAKERMTQ